MSHEPRFTRERNFPVNVTDPEKHADIASIATEVKLMLDLNEQRRAYSYRFDNYTRAFERCKLLQLFREIDPCKCIL